MLTSEDCSGSEEEEDGETLDRHDENHDAELNMILAGYRACAEEAVRFLLQEEHVPLDSPLLTGLWQHLLRQQINLTAEAESWANDSGVSVECPEKSEHCPHGLYSSLNGTEPAKSVTTEVPPPVRSTSSTSSQEKDNDSNHANRILRFHDSEVRCTELPMRSEKGYACGT